jgi:NADPH-dependent 2,4-dienoyl-CoA reductase/sulfur reductase-like enzyme
MEMSATVGDKQRQMWDRLVLLLIASPREGWEPEFEEITRREIERLALPIEEPERCG